MNARREGFKLPRQPTRGTLQFEREEKEAREQEERERPENQLKLIEDKK